jgi:hypothetical protein
MFGVISVHGALDFCGRIVFWQNPGPEKEGDEARIEIGNHWRAENHHRLPAGQRNGTRASLA